MSSPRTLRLAAVFALLVASSTFAQDTVFKKGNQSERGTVTGMTKKGVTLASNGGDQTISANDILRISYTDEPQEMGDIRKAVHESNYKSALQDIGKINLASVDREFLRQEIEYFKALSLAKLAMTEGGDKAAAEKELLNFVKKYKDSYRFFTVAELLGDVASSAGKFPEAEKYYAPVTGAEWDDMRLRATVSLGRALASQGKSAEALAKFEAVVNDPVNTADTAPMKQLATVGKAAAMVETGKADEAIKMLNDQGGIIATNDPFKDKVLMARSYNTLGNAYLKQGKKKEALVSFLFTHLLFFNDPDAHAEALYNIAKLYADAERSDKSLEARTTLTQRYAGSVWATAKK